MSNALPYSIPPEPGGWPAFALAVFVHALLFMFLWVGIRWQNEPPATIEAEIWSPIAREAGSGPVPIQVPQPEPTPAITPPAETPPAPKIKEAPAERPDIALEQEKKKKARAEEDKIEKKKAEKQQADEKKKEADQKAAEKKAADKAKTLAADKQRQQETLDAKLAALLSAADKKRITADAGGGGNGSAAKSQGSRGDATWAQRIAAKIKSNTIFAASSAELEVNPAVEFEVRLLPDGSVGGARQTKSSGIPGFDEAVRRAIYKSEPYPADSSGKFPPITISYRPKDIGP